MTVNSVRKGKEDFVLCLSRRESLQKIWFCLFLKTKGFFAIFFFKLRLAVHGYFSTTGFPSVLSFSGDKCAFQF